MRRLWDISFPHPVLREGSSDYLRGVFRGHTTLQVDPDASAVSLRVGFELEECPDLTERVVSREAACCALVKCPMTYHRSLLFAEGGTAGDRMENGRVDGEIEVLPLVVAKDRITAYRSRDFHADYGGRAFDLEPGSVLAVGRPEIYHIDTTFLGPISSVFRIVDRSMGAGVFKYEIDDEMIAICMSEKTRKRFDALRSNARSLRQVFAGVYLPLVVSVLRDLDRDPERYSGYRWARAIRQTLTRLGLRLPEENTNDDADRLHDAQVILREPLGDILSTGD